jgi:hypothetical protein
MHRGPVKGADERSLIGCAGGVGASMQESGGERLERRGDAMLQFRPLRI